MVQWLGLCIFTAEGLGSVTDPGTRIPEATGCGQKKKKRTQENNLPALMSLYQLSLKEVSSYTNVTLKLISKLSMYFIIRLHYLNN